MRKWQRLLFLSGQRLLRLLLIVVYRTLLSERVASERMAATSLSYSTVATVVID